MTFDDLKKAVFSEWLKIALILATVIGGWYKFDFRISQVESREAERAEQVQKLSEVITKLNGTLDRMNQTMRDFPPHRHISDEDVIYPGDTVLRERRKR